MKINVEFDLTPEEFRRAMGLPDVTDLHETLIASVIEKINSAEDGYDAFMLLKPFLTTSMQTMESVQKGFMDAMFNMTSASGDK